MSKILLAEDDASMRQFITGALEKAGYQVTACGDGLSALNKLRGGTYDLLLTDIVMPGVDGIELAGQARKLHPSIKIVYITGFAAMAQKDESKEGHAPARLISKPFHLGRLTSEIADILGKPL